MPRNVAATGLHWMTRTAFKKENICKHDVSFGWWQPCAQRLRKRLCVMCSASHDAIAKCQHSDCLAGAKIRQKKAFVKSILRKGYSFLALTIEICQKKCSHLKKSTFLEAMLYGWLRGAVSELKSDENEERKQELLRTALWSRVQMVFERNITPAVMGGDKKRHQGKQQTPS